MSLLLYHLPHSQQEEPVPAVKLVIDKEGKKKKKRGTKNKNKKDFQIQSMSHKSSFLYYSLNNQSTSYFAVLTSYRTATILPILYLHYPFHERTIAGADFILLLFHQ